MILVVASATAALAVVGFTYGLFGTATNKSVITGVGNAYIKYNPGNGAVEICLTMKNSGPEVPTVTSVSIGDTPVSVTTITDVNGGTTISGPSVTVLPGTNSLTITGNVQPQLQLGSVVFLYLTLSNGVVLVVSAVVEAQ